ncbi:MAG: fluoride efflux transporter CrcB [Myxococcales bacterium]|nr:MAG: fluoride efflux transporter CrcB [Myxococcales bacterium]
MKLWWAVAMAGAVGSLMRYALGMTLQRYLGSAFGYGTLLANVLGCFCIGFVMQLSERSIISAEWRIPIVIGLLGGFTTFSSFGYDTVHYMQNGNHVLALTNTMGNLILGLSGVWIGLYLAKVF